MSTVVTMGYQPQGSMSLVTTLGYSLFANITPPPPAPPDQVVLYGPALTPAERRRWFGDFESPISRAARRKTKEYLQRVEFGILPPEVKEEIAEKAVLKIPEVTKQVMEERVARNVTKPFQVDRIINRVLREIRVDIATELEKRRLIKEEEAEEEDIAVIASSFFL